MSTDELFRALKNLSQHAYGEYALTIKLPEQQHWVSDIYDPDTDRLAVELEVSA